MSKEQVMVSAGSTTRQIVNRLKAKYPLPEMDGGWDRVRDDPEFFETLCHAISKGHSVTDFCDSVGLMPTRVNTWLGRLDGERQEMYAAARESRAQFMAEQILDVTRKVETGELPVPQARTMVDALKWHAERLDPEHWGAKLHVQAELKTTTEMHLEAVRELAERIRDGDPRPVIEGEVEPKLNRPVELPEGVLADSPVLTPRAKPKRTREEIVAESKAKKKAAYQAAVDALLE